MCSVTGCDSSRHSAQLFNLPEDPEERLEWVTFIAKVNKQRFKESSWTDISVCSNHFTDDCLVNVTDRVQLKPGAVPSLCSHLGADESSEFLEATTEDESSSSITEIPETVAAINKQRDPKDESTESSDSSGTDSDDSDYEPPRGVFPVKLFRAKQSNVSVEHADYCDYLSLTPVHNQLCTDCGKFFDKRKPHTCEHKIKPYSCNICGKRCVSEVALNSHSRVHNEDYEFRCKFCNVTFKLKADKFAHEQIHITQGRPYKCPDCSQTFATNKERRIHLEDHRGTIELKCRYCGLEFFRALSIQRHLLIHTGAKPYKCSVCQRAFNQSSHLKSHMRLHTGERPFKCRHCEKCFNHNVSLKTHIQRYHPERSGAEPKKDAANNQTLTSNTNCSQSNRFRKITSQDVASEEEEQYTNSDAQITDDETQMERVDRSKSKRKGTGRPIGRPKNFKSNTVKNRKLHGKRQKQLTFEENEPPGASPSQGKG